MPDLPTGTVTFLFTDIEGSTRLWEEHPEAMRQALAQHDTLLRACIETNRGRVFKTGGDAFCAVFPNPRDAVQAVLASQQWLPALALATPEGSRPLRVRMALHTGVAEEREGDYFGPPLNRVARLLAIGHGGQVLLSAATQELVRDTLPAGAALKSLGEHRLRDLQRPEAVFQLLHPELPRDFPPLRSLDNPRLPNNLPQQRTSFVGREKELGEVREIFGKARLLTLTGSGGTGKTRLALQVAAELVEQYPDGVWLVELAPLSEPELVPQAVATVLQVREEPGRPLTSTLAEQLKTRQLLLVLDNAEHLLAACATFVDAILTAGPTVQFLVSSREGLGIAGELTYRVPSLSTPNLRHPPPLEELDQYEAVRLFIERAAFSQPAFRVTSDNALAVVEIACRLDGIPLAIELAAARVKAMAVEKIAERLHDRFRLLTGGSRTALPRQQTLRALIDWSYDLLTDQERQLLRRLAVFASGWTLEAAEAVGAGEPIEEWEVLDLLTTLVEKSLVGYGEAGAEGRYRLLETVRQYARDRLLESGEAEALRGRHRDYFLALAEAAKPHLTGAEQAAWLDRLETEHDNFRAALEWSGGEEAEGGLRLAGALWRFWAVRGYLGEGRERLGAALQAAATHAELHGSGARAQALIGAGMLASDQGDYAAARSLYEESMAIQRELGDRGGIATSLNNLGRIAAEQGDYAAARSLYEESLAIRQELRDEAGIAASLNNLGLVANDQGDYAAARALYEQALAVNRAIGNRAWEAINLNNLGNVAGDQGDNVAARSLHEESLAIRRELGDKRGIAGSLHNLGRIAAEQGDYPAARSLYEKALVIERELGNKWGIPASLESFADLAAAQGREWERAARLWGAAAALREAIGTPLAPNKRQEYEREVGAARAALGEQAFDRAWQEGRTMTLESAIASALE